MRSPTCWASLHSGFEMPSHEAWMQAAIDESLRGMRSNQGGPFGAVIVFVVP
jgi:tRNA(Arg) A34 adenosine deaminase TadA